MVSTLLCTLPRRNLPLLSSDATLHVVCQLPIIFLWQGSGLPVSGLDRQGSHYLVKQKNKLKQRWFWQFYVNTSKLQCYSVLVFGNWNVNYLWWQIISNESSNIPAILLCVPCCTVLKSKHSCLSDSIILVIHCHCYHGSLSLLSLFIVIDVIMHCNCNPFYILFIVGIAYSSLYISHCYCCHSIVIVCIVHSHNSSLYMVSVHSPLFIVYLVLFIVIMALCSIFIDIIIVIHSYCVLLLFIVIIIHFYLCLLFDFIVSIVYCHVLL